MDNVIQQYGKSYITSLIDGKIQYFNNEIKTRKFKEYQDTLEQDIIKLNLFKDFLMSSDSVCVNLDFLTYTKLQ